jgi:hypothetical protein
MLGIGLRAAGRGRPAQGRKKWPWQVRLMWLFVIVGIGVQFPVGRAILIVAGGLLVACVIGVLAMAFSAAGSGSGRKGPFEEYLEQQEEARR